MDSWQFQSPDWANFSATEVIRRKGPMALVRLCPVTATVGLTAVAVTLWWWAGGDVDLLTMSARAWFTQPWRLFASVFPHVNLLHLAFNLYWLFVFGLWIEQVFGSLRMAAIMLLLAVGSNVAEYALARGGVGLSGVGYGFFGLLWVLHSRDPRFYGSINRNIILLFLGWFCFCVLATLAEVMNVGNVAHGSGAVLGVLLGFVVAAPSRDRRLRYSLSLGAVLLAIVLAGSVARPYVNFSGALGEDLSHQAYRALRDEDYQRAVTLYRQALARNGDRAPCWYNLGVAHQRLDQHDESHDAFQHAYELAPDEGDFKSALWQLKMYLASEAARGELRSGRRTLSPSGRAGRFRRGSVAQSRAGVPASRPHRGSPGSSGKSGCSRPELDSVSTLTATSAQRGQGKEGGVMVKEIPVPFDSFDFSAATNTAAR